MGRPRFTDLGRRMHGLSSTSTWSSIMAVTILKVEKLTRGNVQIRFASRGGGCPNWQTIVDDTGRLIDALCGPMQGEATFVDGEKSLGRGARVQLPRRVYLAVRIALEHHHAAKSALKTQRLMIDDAEVVAPLSLKMARGYLPQQPGWLDVVRDLDVCTL